MKNMELLDERNFLTAKELRDVVFDRQVSVTTINVMIRKDEIVCDKLCTSWPLVIDNPPLIDSLQLTDRNFILSQEGFLYPLKTHTYKVTEPPV